MIRAFSPPQSMGMGSPPLSPHRLGPSTIALVGKQLRGITGRVWKQKVHPPLPPLWGGFGGCAWPDNSSSAAVTLDEKLNG